MSVQAQAVRTSNAPASTAAPSHLGRRLEALGTLVERGTGRLDAAALSAARAVIDRAGQRLRLSGEHTVVALAGATGSGKSTLFNSLAGLDLSATGVRRPTTSHPVACVWGPEGAGPLLDWLGIPQRYQIARESALDLQPDRALQGLVLLDLPDHDSTELSHRLEVDRLVELVDLLVWVLDPQKYADAAVHERYLRPLAQHAGVTVVVLNQVDRLDQDAARACLADLQRLLAEDGLHGVPVVPTSARTGAGVDTLRGVLVDRLAEHRARAERLAADVDRVATTLSAGMGERLPAGRGKDRRVIGSAEDAALVQALCGAAGVPVVAAAVESAHRHRGVAATGWPFTRWVRRLRPDPLRRLRLGDDVVAAARSSLPAPTPVQRSQVETAVRRAGDSAAAGLPQGWADAIRRAARPDSADLADALDRAVASTDLGTADTPRWWRWAGALQWLSAAAVVIGLGWLGVLVLLGYLRVPEPPTPEVEGWPVPTLLVAGGVLLGLVLAAVFRILVGVGARRRRRRAERRLRQAVREVALRLVVDPVEAEALRYAEARAALDAVRR